MLIQGRHGVAGSLPCLYNLVKKKLRATAGLQNQEGRKALSLCDDLPKEIPPSLTDLGYFSFSFSIQVNPADGENYFSMVELTFVFSMIWSVCASVDEESRKKIDSYLREMEGSFPNKVRGPNPAVLFTRFSRTHLHP